MQRNELNTINSNLRDVRENDALLFEYLYDSQGRRVKSHNHLTGVTTTYIYSGINVIQEITSTESIDYIYANGMRIAKKIGATVKYFHSDHLGSARLVTDSLGQPAFEGDYKPFGEEASAIGSEKYAFTGQYNEAEIGLYYFGARWYDASLGRFISEDPIKGSMISSQSQNPYVYCMNNPLRYIDPSGMLMTDPEGNEYHDGYLQSYSGGDWIYYPESGGSCNVSGECYREDHFAPSQSPITPPANLPDCASYGGKYFRKSSYTPNSATYEGNRPSITKPGATVDPCAGFRRTDVWIPEHPPIRLTELHFTWGCLVGSADINIVYDSNNMKGYVEVGLNPGVASPNLTILPAISLNDVKLYSITEYKNADTITFGGGYQAYGEITFYNKDGDGKAEIFSHTVLGYTPSPCIAITSNKHYWEWGMDFG